MNRRKSLVSRRKRDETQLITSSKVVNRMIRRAMDREVEDKYFTVPILYQTTVTSSVTSPATPILLSVDSMTQGTDSGQRIGDYIRVKRANLNIACIQNGGTVVIGPTLLSLYIARARSNPTTTPTNAQYQVIKQSYNTPGGFSNEDSSQPNSFYTLVNEQVWEVAHHSTHLIGLAQPSVATGVGTNNDSVMYKGINIDLTRFFPGKSRFNGSTAVNNCWYLFAYAYEVTASPTVSAVYPIVRGTLNFLYEDA